MPLPPRYRDAFRNGVVLSQGSPDKCLRIYTQEAFAVQAAKTVAQPSLTRSGRDLRKSFFSRSIDAELDKQHRILIPGALRDYAALSGKVLVIGAGEWMEIWAPNEYAAEMARVDADLEATMESAQAREA